MSLISSSIKKQKTAQTPNYQRKYRKYLFIIISLQTTYSSRDTIPLRHFIRAFFVLQCPLSLCPYMNRTCSISSIYSPVFHPENWTARRSFFLLIVLYRKTAKPGHDRNFETTFFYLKLHKREKFFGSDFEFFTIL